MSADRERPPWMGDGSWFPRPRTAHLAPGVAVMFPFGILTVGAGHVASLAPQPGKLGLVLMVTLLCAMPVFVTRVVDAIRSAREPEYERSAGGLYLRYAVFAAGAATTRLPVLMASGASLGRAAIVLEMLGVVWRAFARARRR